MFDWEDYSANSAMETIALLLSERSQQLALAASAVLDRRTSWNEVDDATWDEIDESLAELYDQLIDVQVSSVTNKAFTMELTTTQSPLAAGSWLTIPFLAIAKNYDGLASYSVPNFKILEAGEYHVQMMLSVRNAVGGVSYKATRLRNVTQLTIPVVGFSTLLSSGGIERSWYAMDDIFECNANDDFQLEIFGLNFATTIEADTIAGITQPPCARAVFAKVR